MGLSAKREMRTKLGEPMMVFNPFHANSPFLYPLKTSDNLWFSDIFREYRNRILA